jgi:hypothetical protein
MSSNKFFICKLTKRQIKTVQKDKSKNILVLAEDNSSFLFYFLVRAYQVYLVSPWATKWISISKGSTKPILMFRHLYQLYIVDLITSINPNLSYIWQDQIYNLNQIFTSTLALPAIALILNAMANMSVHFYL